MWLAVVANCFADQWILIFDLPATQLYMCADASSYPEKIVACTWDWNFSVWLEPPDNIRNS